MNKRQNDDGLIRATEAVRAFFKRHEKYKAIESQYKALQAEFTEAMDEYFGSLSAGRKNALFEDIDGDLIQVSKVERTTIEWLPEKLRKRVTLPVWRKLVRKHYEVTDMPGLIQYLKSCGVDPNIFKAFINVTETVDEKAIERLGDLGELTPHNIAGCYLVHTSKPYYKLKRKSAEDGQGGQ